jgi:hypothetical protein
MDSETKEEKFSTEGDVIVTPYSSLWQKSKPLWNPFSQCMEQICFYHPDQHVDLVKALWDAPIQSREQIEKIN